MKKKNKRALRHRRIRGRIAGTAQRPRLHVFRSNTALYAQLVDDQKGVTLLSINDRSSVSGKGKAKAGQTEKIIRAFEAGKTLAEKAKEKGFERILFDRAGYAYHGRVKAFADGARQGGLSF